MKEEKLVVEKTSRLYSLGESGPQIKRLIIALHGYGQLSAFFMRKFEPLIAPDRRIVAPEGLHRFYLEGTSGRVGASWMTKEARLDDIADQAKHLDAVLEKQLKECPNIQHITLVGFSQGTSTASRWLDHRNGSRIDHFVCWAGEFPPDINFAKRREAFSMRIDAAFGDDDPYTPEERIQEVLSRLNNSGVEPVLHRYKGGHSIEPKLLKQIIERADR